MTHPHTPKSDKFVPVGDIIAPIMARAEREQTERFRTTIIRLLEDAFTAADISRFTGHDLKDIETEITAMRNDSTLAGLFEVSE